jgi:hypothetical protein
LFSGRSKQPESRAPRGLRTILKQELGAKT